MGFKDITANFKKTKMKQKYLSMLSTLFSYYPYYRQNSVDSLFQINEHPLRPKHRAQMNPE